MSLTSICWRWYEGDTYSYRIQSNCNQTTRLNILILGEKISDEHFPLLSYVHIYIYVPLNFSVSIRPYRVCSPRTCAYIYNGRGMGRADVK